MWEEKLAAGRLSGFWARSRAEEENTKLVRVDVTKSKKCIKKKIKIKKGTIIKQIEYILHIQPLRQKVKQSLYTLCF